jgi:hypothetical protein
MPVAHACNPSYSGGRDQKDQDSKPAWANSLKDPISEIPNTKKGWQSGSSGRVPAWQVWNPYRKGRGGEGRGGKEMAANTGLDCNVEPAQRWAGGMNTSVLCLLGLELRAYTLSHSTSPFFFKGFLQDWVSWTVFPGLAWTVILLISASWVARITGVSHWCLDTSVVLTEQANCHSDTLPPWLWGT